MGWVEYTKAMQAELIYCFTSASHLYLHVGRKINFLCFYFLYNLLLTSKLIYRGKGELGGGNTLRPGRVDLVSHQPTTCSVRAGGH